MERDYIMGVAGLGRCGTSLVMQMLDAAGVPVIGEYPSFESEEHNYGLVETPPGYACKYLDMHREELPLPRGKVKWVWMFRNLKQQARSQIKFASAALGIKHHFDGNDIARMANSLRADNSKAVRRIQKHSGPGICILPLSFEGFFSTPEQQAQHLCLYYNIDLFKVPKMAAVVRHHRTSDCYNGLMELELIDEKA